jgi:predicted nucleic acid-binding protein
MDPYLLDTGILLRLLDRDDPLHNTVRQALRLLRSRREQFRTTFQNVCKFWNVSTRPATARGGLGLDVATVERRVRLIDRWCPVFVDTQAVYPTWRRLVSTYKVRGVAVHDARLVAVMLTYQVKRLLTLNERDFRRYEPEGITVISPQSLIAASSPNS